MNKERRRRKGLKQNKAQLTKEQAARDKKHDNSEEQPAMKQLVSRREAQRAWLGGEVVEGVKRTEEGHE